MRCGTLKCLKKFNARRVNFTLNFTPKTDVGFSREIYNVEFTRSSLAIADAKEKQMFPGRKPFQSQLSRASE